MTFSPSFIIKKKDPEINLRENSIPGRFSRSRMQRPRNEGGYANILSRGTFKEFEPRLGTERLRSTWSGYLSRRSIHILSLESIRSPFQCGVPTAKSLQGTELSEGNH